MRRTVLAILVVTAAVAGPVRAAWAAPVAPVTDPDLASIGIRLVDAPADAGDDPRAQVHIIDHLSPGTVITRRIEVSSTSPAPMHAALYPAAANIADGSFLGAEGHTANDVSEWTSVSPSAVDVPAGGQAIATVTVTVPTDASAGEQYGVVWAEVRSAPSGAGGLVQVSRVGVRLYLSIGPGGAPAADFTIESLTAQRTADGSPTILASVRNTGGRALDLAGTLELTDGPGGVRAGPFPAVLGTTLAIGEAEPVTIHLDGDLPAGPWDATVTLRSGRIERTARATVTFPDSGSAPAVDATSPGSTSPAPALAAGAAVLMVAAAACFSLLRRRRIHLRLSVAA